MHIEEEVQVRVQQPNLTKSFHWSDVMVIFNPQRFEFLIVKKIDIKERKGPVCYYLSLTKVKCFRDQPSSRPTPYFLLASRLVHNEEKELTHFR